MLKRLKEFGRFGAFGLCLLILSDRGVLADENCPTDIGTGVLGESAEAALEACLSNLASTFVGSEEEQQFKESIITIIHTNGLNPPIPQEYEHFKGQGETAVVVATDIAGFAQAASEFRKATRAAPWLADAYYDLGRTEEKAGNLAAAVAAYRLYLKIRPEAENSEAIRTQIIALEYKADTETIVQTEILENNIEPNNVEQLTEAAAETQEVVEREQTRPFKVSALSKTMYVSTDANVRSGPFNDRDVIATVALNSAVNATGRVVATNWYRIALSDGRQGYVYGSLLTNEAPLSADMPDASTQAEVQSHDDMSGSIEPSNTLPEAFVAEFGEPTETLSDPVEAVKLEAKDKLPETTIVDREEPSELLTDPVSDMPEPPNAIAEAATPDKEELLEPLRDTITTSSIEPAPPLSETEVIDDKLLSENLLEDETLDATEPIGDETPKELPSEPTNIIFEEETPSFGETTEVVNAEISESLPLATGAINDTTTLTLAEKLSGEWYVSRVQIIENNLEQTKPIVAPFSGAGNGNELQIFEDDQLRYSFVLSGNDVVGTEFNRSCDKVTELPVTGTVSNENVISINYTLMMHGCGAVPATGTVMYELQRF